MTQPTVIYLGPDAIRYDESFKPRPAFRQGGTKSNEVSKMRRRLSQNFSPLNSVQFPALPALGSAKVLGYLCYLPDFFLKCH